MAGILQLWIMVVIVGAGILSLAVSGNPPPSSLPVGFVTIHPGKFSKRNYQLTCQDSNYKKPGCNATCPSRCPDECIVFCPTCRTICSICELPGQVCGDPRFTGGDGNTFYFHGRKNKEFCVLSDANLHINAHFIGHRNPTMSRDFTWVHINAHFIGHRNPTMSRDFTWVQAIGILFDSHRLYAGAQKTITWDKDVDRLMITFDGEPVNIPTEHNARWVPKSMPTLSITRSRSTNGLVVELEGKFRIMANVVPITEEDSRIHNYGVTAGDSLAHLDLAFKFFSLTDDVHGVLGQTYRPDYVNIMDVRAKMPVMGGANNYISSNIFSTDCVVSRFGRNRYHIATV